MIRAVLDANQYVSALLKPRSNPARIIELVHAGHVTLLASPAILDEVRQVLSYPKLKKLHRRSPQDIERFLGRIEKIALMTPGVLAIPAVKDDPSDDIYLACALEGDADFIVSGDHHLTELKAFQGIRIVKPAEFLKVVAEPGRL
jgi:putative PIN family toxin of toxin-antitoxin system